MIPDEAELDIQLETLEVHTVTVPSGAQNIPDQKPVVHHQEMSEQFTIKVETDSINPRRRRLMAFWRRTRINIAKYSGIVVWGILLVAVVTGIVVGVVYYLTRIRPSHHHKNIAMKVAAEPSGAGSMSCALAGRKCNADHAAVMPRPVQSQLHQDVVRVLRTAHYTAFAAMLDNMTESVVHQGITVFAPSDGALSDFQKNKTQELRPEEVVRFHVITDVMPFSKLLRLEVGSILTTDVSNITILVTNATAAAYKVDDAVIVDPDLYTEAAIAVHGINAVFNTSLIDEDERNKTVIAGGIPLGGLPFPFHSRAFKTPITVSYGVLVYQILMCFAGLLLTYHLGVKV